MSREAFDEWAKYNLTTIEEDTAWEAWQAAERETVRTCLNIALGWDFGSLIVQDIKKQYKDTLNGMV
jgi:hypothetical protein